ncbi:MAG: MFS transporter [Clostridia bacterium]|nr:MFS transporter [Clostridia bacterium]
MQQSLSTGRKALYGAGDIMGTLAFTVTALFLPYFFTDVLGLPSVLAGLVIFIGNFWDALTDPFAGHISDRTKSRLGRRRPYFLYMALPIGLTFVLLFAVPSGMATSATFILTSIAYIAFMTSTTFYLVPYLAFGMEIEKSYDGRTSLIAWRMLFSIGFGLVGAVVPKIIWEAAETPSKGFLIMAVMLAIPVTISTLFPFFAAKEQKSESLHESHFFNDFKKALKSRSFLKGVIIYVATWAGIGVVQTLLIYYFKYVLCIPEQFELLIGVLFGVTIVALPLWVFLSGRLDKRKAYVIGAVVFILGLAALLMPTHIILKLIWFVIPVLGIGLSALHVMPNAILPEAIEAASEGKSGEGAHYGIVTFIYKMSNALMQLGVLGILGAVGYIETTQESAVVQPASAILAIKMLLVVVPIGMLILGIIMAFAFKIGRHGEIAKQPARITKEAANEH